MKKWVLIAGILILLLSGCEKASDYIGKTSDATEQENASVQIGITFDSFVLERWQRDRDVFVSSAKDLGAEVFVQNANGNTEEQIQQIEYFIQKKMDVIVIVAVDSGALKEEVQKARNEGIKVISYDRLMLDTDSDLYISFNNETVGRFMADAITQALPEGGNVIKINGPKKDNNVKLVNQGFDQEMEKTSFQTIDNYYAEAWKGEEAFEYLEDNSELLDQIQAIMCGNDGLAGQAITYLSEQRMAGKIVVVGQDADLDACQRIVEGTQYMTVYKPIDKLAKLAAECAVRMAKGQNITADGRINDGTYDVPYIYIEPAAVTKDNLDSVILDSGFHLKEDVYLQ